jgi:hemerythrin-like domain-containing protein
MSAGTTTPFVDPASDFSDGLQVLQTYHGSFLQHGRQLLALMEAITAQGLDEQRALEAGSLSHYYTEIIRLHHRDEERIVFPLILNKSFVIDGMIERLALDHEDIEVAWAELHGALQAPERITSSEQSLIWARRFERSLREHIEREDLDFFPEIERWLLPDQCTEAGRLMAQLRTHSRVTRMEPEQSGLQMSLVTADQQTF